MHVHDGEDLISSDSNGLSDPYCIIHANKEKVSHYNSLPTFTALHLKILHYYSSLITANCFN